MRTLVLMAALLLTACNHPHGGYSGGARGAPLILAGPEPPPPQAMPTYISTPGGGRMVCRQVFDMVQCY